MSGTIGTGAFLIGDHARVWVGGCIMGKVSFDLIGIPEYFANTVTLEDAGDGMVRAIYCTHHGVLVPVCSVVRPIANILKIAPNAMDFCRKIMLDEIRAAH